MKKGKDTLINQFFMTSLPSKLNRFEFNTDSAERVSITKYLDDLMKANRPVTQELVIANCNFAEGQLARTFADSCFMTSLRLEKCYFEETKEFEILFDTRPAPMTLYMSSAEKDR